jgi:hypothetical protein
MNQFTRRIIGFGVQAIAVDGPGLCRMFNQAISGHALPSRLSTDQDPLFQFHRWQANLRILEIRSRLQNLNDTIDGSLHEKFQKCFRDRLPGKQRLLSVAIATATGAG